MATISPSIISMGCKSNSLAGVRRSVQTVLWLLFGVVLGTRLASACPFCTALSPTLCQQRERATVTALAELEAAAAGGPATVQLHQVLAGQELIGTRTQFTIPLDLAAERGTLLLLFAQGSTSDDFDWHAVPVNEASYGYFARAPRGTVPADQRLPYFASYLEHPDTLIAEDAYLEFGHAPFDQVAEVVPQLSMEKVRCWLTDPRVPGGRKGFYGLVLGLASEPAEREANASFLRELILKPDDDFRAGFDGVLGGYLMLAPADGLELIESRYLANPKAAVGDVRHAQTALRFYHEYGRNLSTVELAQAVRQLLARPEFAEAAITDLARWQDWSAMPEIVALFQKDGFEQPGVRRAVVGYLLACPEPKATSALAELRTRDPEGVAAAEQVLSTTGSVPQSR